jgi:hypothetical protein
MEGDVGRQHAQEGGRANAVFEVVVHRAQIEVDRLHRTEVPLHTGRPRANPVPRDEPSSDGGRFADWWRRTGSEERTFCLKRDLGWNRTRMDAINGARTRRGHGIFNHNLEKIAGLMVET